MKTPLFNALKAYVNSGTLPFHMPGHKLGKGFPPEFPEMLAALDITELPGMDNLHNPEGILLDAQQLAAKAFGSKSAYFLVNGSTCGIHAMISAICKPGDVLIVSRDCHRSVITGMMLAQARPLYIEPEYDSYFGISLGLTPAKVEKALAENPQAVGVLVTRPNYSGVCSDLKEISRIVHEKGKILAVDEAHGAHLPFSRRLPDSAMECGADICVQSAHKTLPALTQGALLHVGSSRIDEEKLKFYLKMYQTSSPSYIITASIDIAREIMQESGETLLSALIDAIGESKKAYGHPSLHYLLEDGREEFQTDPTRIVLNVRKLGISGYEAERILRSEWGIQAEMSDIYNIVCIATVADDETGISKLFKAFRLMAESREGRELFTCPSAAFGFSSFPRQCIELKDIANTECEKIDITDSVGRISRDIIAPYPPGIPLLCPGEMITAGVAGAITSILASGGFVQGLDRRRKISVVR